MDTFVTLNDNIRLSQINLLGTHDSCTAFVAMENISRCQSFEVKKQLQMGVRLFDIRLYKKDDEFYLVHALADCFENEERTKKLTFTSVLEEFRSFLKENPRETVVVCVKQDRGIMSKSFFPLFYDRYIKENQSLWYLKNTNPLLGECRGKIVLMRRCYVKAQYQKSTDAGLDFSRWIDQGEKNKTNTEKLVMSIDNSNGQPEVICAEIQDRYSLAADKKWEESAKPFLDRCETGKHKFCLHFISTAHRDKGATVADTAKKVNAYFSEYELKKDKAQGWFFVDFPTKEICEKIIKSNLEIYKENLK